MHEEKTNKMVEQAYTTLKNIAELDIHITGGYFELIFARESENVQEYADEVMNQLFWKFCNELFSEKKTNLETMIYHSFTFTTPSDSLLKDCHQIIHNIIVNKEKESNLYSLLQPLSNKYPKEEVEKALDTMFNILLSYYKHVKK